MKNHDSMWIKLSEQIYSIYKQKDHVLNILVQTLGNDHILCNYKYYKYDDFIIMLYRILKHFYPYNTKYITVDNIKYNIETLLTPGKSEYSIYKTDHVYESPHNKMLFLDDKLYIERYSIYFKSLINDLLFECTMFKSFTDYDAFTRELLRIRNIITEFHTACMELSTLDCPIPDELCNSIHRDVIRFDSEWI
jgi:hypothetical protein